MKHFQQKKDFYARQRTDNVAYRMYSEIENMQSHVKEARKQVGFAEMRLKWIKQQFSVLFVEYIISTTQISIFDRRKNQVKLSKKALNSGQITFKDFKFNRFDKSVSRSNYNNEKKRSLTNFAFDLIHSLKVLKIVAKKTFRSRWSLKIPAERDDGQNHDCNIIILSPSLINVPRRNRRLSINQKRSGALKAGLIVEQGKNA